MNRGRRATWDFQAKMECKGQKDPQESRVKQDSQVYMVSLGLEESLDLLAPVDLLDHPGTPRWDEKLLSY